MQGRELGEVALGRGSNTTGVSPELDLIETAAAFAEDNASRVKGWLTAGRVRPVSDDEARAWHDADVLVWAVVVKPYVLVQHPNDD